MGVFKTKKRNENIKFDTPQEMYDDYKNRKIDGIHDYQSKLIDRYLENKEKKDIAIELPTGTGKTLVGLLIGEFKRRKDKYKTVYLCTTKQLVNQTVESAKNTYGIKAIGFTGSAKEYNGNDKLMYQTGESIAITNYSSLFNTNSFFKNADLLIFDDAHSGENFISSNWTVTIKRNVSLYNLILNNVKSIIDDNVYSKLIDNDPGQNEKLWFDKIPNIKLWDLYSLFQKVIDDYIQESPEDKIKYSWSNIRDSLHACNIFLSWKEIVIRPYIPPTSTHKPFINAKQRIYMTATPGKSGEIERVFGVDKICRLPIVKDWENKTIGRKFFIFPQVSFDDKFNGEIIKKITEITSRTLMIVKDNDTQKSVLNFLENSTSVKAFTGTDIERSKNEFVKCNNGFMVIANRFDGIDFPNDECRMLILFDLPNATHLQEKFLMTRMSAMILFEERIKTRIVQALGRCTRSHTDYSVVCLFGDDLMNSILSPAKLEQFNPELQAELIFGQENSKDKKNIDEYLELVNIFLKHGEEWEEAENGIIDIRNDIIEENKVMDNNSYEALSNSAEFEVKAQYSIWKKDYVKALHYIEKILAILKNEELKGYKGFWSYIAGYCSYAICKEGDITYEGKYKNYFRKAAGTTISVTWFNKLQYIEEDQRKSSGMEYIIEKIEKNISNYSRKSLEKFTNYMDDIVNLLESSNGEKFENGYELLGDLIGYKTINPKEDGAPDPIWIINEKLCIVSENKIYKSKDKKIPVCDVRQAAGHINWVQNYNLKLSMISNAKILTLFISNSNNIENSAVIHAKGIYYISRKEIIEWAKKCFEILKSIKINFSSIGDVVWREHVIKKFESEKLSPMDFINLIKKKKLSDL